MSPTSRRILAYWLLLLIPTLGVGLGAVVLLRREQSRLQDRAAYADEARRAAVSARARLIAENVELLVGDVQSGLLDVMAAEPADELDALFTQLERTNPLIRTVFQCAADGTVVRSIPASTSDEGRGFLRRFGARLRETPPWRTAGTKAESSHVPAPETKEIEEQAAHKKAADESRSRQQVASNVYKVQNARRDVQALARNSYVSAPRAEADALMDETVAPAPTGANSAAFEKTVQRNGNDFGGGPAAREQRGWLALKVDGRLHLLGWVKPASSLTVRGVEIEMAALISRLAGTLPAEISGEEGYVLRDEQQRVLHQVGAVNGQAAPAMVVPLAMDQLPGWEVVSYLPSLVGTSAGNGGLFWASSLLVGLLIVAIVAGGSLLLQQARRSEAEAAQKTSFVANVSHEFKTPLTTIRLYAELLEQGRVRDAAQSGEYLRTIGRETQRLARLVGNALDFSRLEQGQKKYSREPLELRAVLTRLLDTQAPRLAEAGLVLQREMPAESVAVTSDRDAIEQIVLNLLDNAAKYGAAGGEVLVTLQSRPTSGAEIMVLDRGPGVPPSHQERIFEKFHRVDDTLTAEKSGTGLGLSIARQLARGLGGDLRYQARAGGGAGFVLSLP